MQKPARGMLGHSPIYFTDQNMVLDTVQEWITTAADGPVKVKVKQSHYRPEQVQRVPRS